MKLLSILTTAAVATAASISNPWSPIPGYPLGIPWCLSDAQAEFLVNTFSTMLSNTDRSATNKTGQVLIADGFTETSDSINTLAGFPLGSSSFTSKQDYITSLVYAPPIPSFTTLDIFHGCTKISWRWNIPQLGRSIYPIKGINTFEVNPKTGQMMNNNLEFNSIAWGTDVGWTCTPPAGPPPA